LQHPTSDTITPTDRNWLRTLAAYREPNQWRSVFELAITGILFLALWVAAWWSLSISYWLTLAICLPAGVFLTRLFLIQHDCGHGAFFRSRVLNDWIGRILGVITLTPYDIWRRSHTIHHGTSSNLGKRGTGDLDTLTVREYYALPRLKRLAYRLYRHPLVMFGIGPAYMYLLRNRLPLGFMTEGPRYWFSAMGTNLTVAISIGLMIYLLGLEPFFFVFLPTTIFAATIGIWLFYVQHQFEHTYWASDEEWNLNDAALYGSSHFDLPGIFKWLTAYIGIHHVHHFYSRIPFYRLPEVLRDYPELANVRRLTFLQSFSCLNLRLWDENQQRLVPFPALGASATR
jgi:acyl-lipid omega-6 desaturase (Delta-12 desaturase)